MTVSDGQNDEYLVIVSNSNSEASTNSSNAKLYSFVLCFFTLILVESSVVESRTFTEGAIQKWLPKLVTKSDIRGRGYMRIVTSPSKKNLCIISFYFLLVFGQRGSSWPFVSIPALKLFQVLALVRLLNKAKQSLTFTKLNLLVLV